MAKTLEAHASDEFAAARNRLQVEVERRISDASGRVARRVVASSAVAAATAELLKSLSSHQPIQSPETRQHAQAVLEEVGLTDAEIQAALDGELHNAFRRIATAASVRAAGGDETLMATFAGEDLAEFTLIAAAEDPAAALKVARDQVPPDMVPLIESLASGDGDKLRQDARALVLARLTAAAPVGLRPVISQLFQERVVDGLDAAALEATLEVVMGQQLDGRTKAALVGRIEATDAEGTLELLMRKVLAATLADASAKHPVLRGAIGDSAEFTDLLVSGQAPEVLVARAHGRIDHEIAAQRMRAAVEVEHVVALAGLAPEETLIAVVPAPYRSVIKRTWRGDSSVDTFRELARVTVAEQLGPNTARLLSSGSFGVAQIEDVLRAALEVIAKSVEEPSLTTIPNLLENHQSRDIDNIVSAVLERAVTDPQSAAGKLTPEAKRLLAQLRRASADEGLATDAREVVLAEIKEYLRKVHLPDGRQIDTTALELNDSANTDERLTEVFATIAIAQLAVVPEVREAFGPTAFVQLGMWLRGETDLEWRSALTQRIARNSTQRLSKLLWPWLRATLEGAAAVSRMPESARQSLLSLIERHFLALQPIGVDNSISEIELLLEEAGLSPTEVEGVLTGQPILLRHRLLESAGSASDGPISRLLDKLQTVGTATEAMLLVIEQPLRKLDEHTAAIVLRVMKPEPCIARGNCAENPPEAVPPTDAARLLQRILPNFQEDEALDFVQGSDAVREEIADRVLSRLSCGKLSDVEACSWRHLPEAVRQTLSKNTSQNLKPAELSSLLQGWLDGPANGRAQRILKDVGTALEVATGRNLPPVVVGASLPISDVIAVTATHAAADESANPTVSALSVSARVKFRRARFARFKARSELAQECQRLGLPPAQCICCPPNSGYGPGRRCPGQTGENICSTAAQ